MNHSSGHRFLYDDLRQYEPIDWPGRQLVEQDNMGDWGDWLSQFDGWLQDVLQVAHEDVIPLARAIAQDYITECCAAG